MSVSVIVGKLTEANSFRVEDIETKYPKGLIIRRNTIKNFKIWFRSIKRPIIGTRVLICITDSNPIGQRDFYSFIQILEEIAEHNYADVLWHILNPKGNFSDTITKLDLVILKDTHRKDFLMYLENRYKNKEICLHILKKIAYNYNAYKLYEKEIELVFKTKSVITERDIDNLFTSNSCRR